MAPLTKEQIQANIKVNEELGIFPYPLKYFQWVMVVLVTLTLLLRLYVRGIMLRAIAMDDILLILSWCTYMIYATSVLILIHMSEDPGTVAALFPIIKLSLTAICGYIANIVTVKMALAALYLRVVEQRWQRLVIIYSLVFFLCVKLVTFHLDIFQCGKPIPQNFLIPKNCPLQWNVVGGVSYFSTGLNAIFDWVMTAIPIYVISKLQMPRRDKILVSILIGLGAISSVVSVVRIPYIGKLKLTGDLHYIANLVLIGELSTLELSMAMIATSMSAYRPLFQRFSDTTKETGPTSGGSGGYTRQVESKPRSRGLSISRTGPTRDFSDHKEGGHVVVMSDGYKPGAHFETIEMDQSPLVNYSHSGAHAHTGGWGRRQ